MIRSRFWPSAVAVTLALPPGPAPRSAESPVPRPQSPSVLDTAALEAVLLDEMRQTRTPGVAIAVVSGDRIIYAKGFGVASIETKEPVTPETLFRLGSVTKMFTGLTAAAMSVDGKLALDAPIGRYAKGLRAPLSSLTLAQLLTHTAGVTNEAANTGPHDDEALGERVRQWGAEHIFAPPGDVYSYTGPGYWLAGYAIEQAAGTWFADAVAERVLAPLGMTRSAFRPTAAMTWPLALDHRVTADDVTVIRPYPDDASTWPSGSLFSSAQELARFALALLDDGRVDGRPAVPASAVRMLTTRQPSAPGNACGYNYGLSDCLRDSVRTLSHYGFRVGSGAVFTVAPEHRFAVIILANRNGGIFGRTERKAMELMLPLRPLGGEPPRPESLGAESRRRFAGAYASGSDTLRFVARGDSLLYRYRANEQPVAADATDRDALLILGPGGAPVQRFSLVRGRGGRNVYLHDGLSAFRRIEPPR